MIKINSSIISLSILFSFALLTTVSCQTQHGDTQSNMEIIGELPSKAKESSGLALAGQDAFWTHNDHGNKPNLYKIDKSGNLLETIKFTSLTNIDWEELTEDDQGYIYIGDFGNGKNDRKDLVLSLIHI